MAVKSFITLDPSYGKKAVEWLRDHVISHLEGCFPVPDDPDPGPPGSNVINLFFPSH